MEKLIITTPENLRSLIHESVSDAFRKMPLPVIKPDSEYLTRIETAQKLKISLPTLWKITKEGKINSYKIGTKVLYKLHEVENVASQTNFNPKNIK
jgi:excisionase family DNA binding protein